MPSQNTRARSVPNNRISFGVLLLTGLLLAPAACGSDDHPGTATVTGDSGGASAAGGALSAKGGNAGAHSGARSGGGAAADAGVAGEGAETGSFGATSGADSGGASTTSGGRNAEAGGTSVTSGGATFGNAGTSSVGADGGAGAECTAMTAVCSYGDNSCCGDAACYAPSGADGFCATRCVENVDCDGSQPGCCAPLAENGARVCVPNELCP